jgi:ubiquinone/menaquinone biosynthesis C-methylase UbiE/uncharacterized protein YbaR (Trm112 family)
LLCHHPRRMEGVAPSAGPVVIPDAVRASLRCPACGGTLDESAGFECAECGRAYPIVDGIPVLVPDGAEDEAAASGHKRRQAEFFGEEASPEWEITRPHGAPAWHRWILEEKQRRGISALGGSLAGMSALTVCGGSGMDAEFLARAGAMPVVSTDLSLGAARRAAERARRFDLPLIPIVADVERLPFADRSFDLVFVHDGLHHLEEPALGLRDMARVARRAVSINEPARARATSVAVRAGLSIEEEEAGNRVARMTIDEIEAELEPAGFEIVEAQRYAMLYRHEPGLPSRALSVRGVGGLARASWHALNAPIGRFGNKLTVQGIRRHPG